MIEPDREVSEPDIHPLRPKALEQAPLLRDLIESFTFAIIMALVIKSFLAEAYKVPTGSMEPTIHGAQENGDRILVNQLVYDVRAPRRWEIGVFKYPNNRQVNYVKRIVGVGPESISIIDGDIYTAPLGTTDTSLRLLYDNKQLKIETKPKVVQDAIFDSYPCIQPGSTRWGSMSDFLDDWIVSKSQLPGQVEWRFDEGVIASCKSKSLVHFRHEIRDQRDPFSDIGPTNRRGKFEIGDLRLAFTCRPEKQGGFVYCEIRDPHHDDKIVAKIPIAGESTEGGVYLGKSKIASIPPGTIPWQEETAIRFTNVDNRIELLVGDERIVAVSYTHLPRLLTSSALWPAGVAFGLEGTSCRFSQVQIYRDIYYRGAGGHRPTSIFEPSYDSWRTDIPADFFYVLGDNSPASNDSREWTRKTISFLDSDVELTGDKMAVVDPAILENRLDNPYTLEETSKDGKLEAHQYFVDDFGNRHELSQYGQVKGIDEVFSPLVPRHLFVGRAYAVFLPFARMKLIR